MSQPSLGDEHHAGGDGGSDAPSRGYDGGAGAADGGDVGGDAGGDWPRFSLRCGSARALFSALSAVYSHKKDQYATIAVNAKGLRVVCGNAAKSLHATAYVAVSAFDEFDLPLVRGPSTEVAFRVNTNVLLECLLMYSLPALTTTVVALQYDAVSKGWWRGGWGGGDGLLMRGARACGARTRGECARGGSHTAAEATRRWTHGGGRLTGERTRERVRWNAPPEATPVPLNPPSTLPAHNPFRAATARC